MLVQVKHRGRVFIQSFYYKNKRGLAKIRVRRNNKVQKQTYNNCFYGRHIYPEVRELQYPGPDFPIGNIGHWPRARQ